MYSPQRGAVLLELALIVAIFGTIVTLSSLHQSLAEQKQIAQYAAAEAGASASTDAGAAGFQQDCAAGDSYDLSTSDKDVSLVSEEAEGLLGTEARLCKVCHETSITAPSPDGGKGSAGGKICVLVGGSEAKRGQAASQSIAQCATDKNKCNNIGLPEKWFANKEGILQEGPSAGFNACALGFACDAAATEKAVAANIAGRVADIEKELASIQGGVESGKIPQGDVAAQEKLNALTTERARLLAEEKGTYDFGSFEDQLKQTPGYDPETGKITVQMEPSPGNNSSFEDLQDIENLRSDLRWTSAELDGVGRREQLPMFQKELDRAKEAYNNCSFFCGKYLKRVEAAEEDLQHVKESLVAEHPLGEVYVAQHERKEELAAAEKELADTQSLASKGFLGRAWNGRFSKVSSEEISQAEEKVAQAKAALGDSGASPIAPAPRATASVDKGTPTEASGKSFDDYVSEAQARASSAGNESDDKTSLNAYNDYPFLQGFKNLPSGESIIPLKEAFSKLQPAEDGEFPSVGAPGVSIANPGEYIAQFPEGIPNYKNPADADLTDNTSAGLLLDEAAKAKGAPTADPNKGVSVPVPGAGPTGGKVVVPPPNQVPPPTQGPPNPPNNPLEDLLGKDGKNMLGQLQKMLGGLGGKGGNKGGGGGSKNGSGGEQGKTNKNACAQYPGTTLQGDRCSCPQGKGWNGNACVEQNPCKQFEGTTLVNGQCQCPQTQQWNGQKCADENEQNPTALKAELACSPPQQEKGEKIAISWACTNASTASADGFTIPTGKSGTQLSGTAETTAVLADGKAAEVMRLALTCVKNGQTQTATCEVGTYRSFIVLVATPQSVESGKPVRIGWITGGMKNEAGACVLTSDKMANVRREGRSGVLEIPSLTQPTTFKLDCTTLSGTPKSAEVEVAVFAR